MAQGPKQSGGCGVGLVQILIGGVLGVIAASMFSHPVDSVVADGGRVALAAVAVALVGNGLRSLGVRD